MRTIVEPKENIVKLWGKQQIKNENTYRMMRYVMRVDDNDDVLLHNVVTGQLIVLDTAEAKMLDHLPGKYCVTMAQLIDDHFLVPCDYDEHRQVVNMRTILRKLAAAQRSAEIRHYTILPTSACNARCYYCFEHGMKTATMSQSTADNVVDFISTHCGKDKKVSIMWFGGEPTVAADRIDQISNGLKDKGITFVSTMISNGYLFDEEMVNKAKSLWNLKRVQISVDGMEEHYNEVKNYVNALDNPFIRVMRNIRLLLEKEIHVDLRMNFDIGNYKDFERLLKYATTYYKEYKGLKVYAYPVIGDYPDKTGKILHGSDEWRRKTSIELNDRARSAGMYQQKDELPHLKYIGCSADQDNSVTINPQGMLVECPEQFDECQSIGNLEEGIVNKELVNQWKMIADHERCRECVFFPRCVRLMNCSAKDNCYFEDRNKQFYEAVRRRFHERSIIK